ncbi:MAG: LysR family transcriptional regulator [Aquabacterium sp.]|uniref:LysR family transcriptional regulator n=1 Tax=Aquabacterium sp. TaxID=1872578 RepID=UPI0025BB440B|nr:LysR family transcriptional regulator [Aquabacterium sp.]MBI3382051.1 LysR family transcriptional regulator [Aquabacterium sp.]
MIAKMQYKLTAGDLAFLLALVRTGTLAAAGERLGVDGSTVFRALQRAEQGLGVRLFERTRSGYQASELALELAGHAERAEAALESARSAAQASPGQVCGTVKITTTDTVLHALVAPALKPLQAAHPLLSYELVAGNELASLTRRDADIAVRATRRPPAHLVGKHVGPIRVGLFTARKGGLKSFDAKAAATASWIAPDDALPEHPSVLWRKKHFPMVQPRYRVNSILTVAELVGQGMGIGLLPLFLAHARSDLRQLGGEIEACQTELWLLTHTDTRHLRRVSAVYGHLARHLALA